MKYKLKYRLFSILLVCILSFNTVNNARVDASGILFTMGELLVGVGGKSLVATLGSVGAAVAGPLLIGACVLGGGYLIYKNKDAIYSQFKEWYESGSTYVKSWMDTTSAKIQNGEITDNSTLTIPRAVYEETKQYVEEVSKTYNNGSELLVNEKTIELHNVREMINDNLIQAHYKNSGFVSYAPVAVMYKNDGAYGSMGFKVSSIRPKIVTDNILIIAPFSATGTGTIYYRAFYTNENDILNKSIINSNIESASSALLSYAQREPYFRKEWSKYTYDGTKFMFGDGYTMDVFMPTTGKIMITDDVIIVNSISDSAVNFGDGIRINIDDFDIITNDNVIIRDNLIEHSKVYNPSYNDVGEIEIPLTPTNVNALNDYIVKESTNAYDLVSTLNPGAVNDKESIPIPETGVVDNILDGISDFFTNPLASILAFLQSILDAILAIPSAIIAIPGQFADWWEKLWEKIQEIIDSILAIPGSLINMLQGVLEWLFVPDSVAINEYVIELEKTITSRYGLLTYPLSLVIRFLNELNKVDNKDCILKIPKIEFKGYTLLEQYEFNFTQYVKKSEFSEIYNYYRLITNFILIIAVINLAIKKGSEIIRGN